MPLDETSTENTGYLELLIGAVVAGVLLAAALWILVWRIVSRAVDNGLDWLIHTFGNEAAAKEIEEKWRDKGGKFIG